MSKVFLDYGHGGSDPGAIGNGVREKDLTLQIGLKVAKLLRSAKQTVVESRTTDKYLSLAQRTRLANNSKADLFVSIHINSFTRATAHGVETFNHTGSANGAKLAKAIQDELVKTKLFRANRGVKTANFYVIRNTTMPAALTELGFISNKEDVKIMTKHQDELAKAIADGILKYLGKGAIKPTTPSKPTAPKPKPTPSKPTTSGGSIVNYLKDKKIDSSLANRKKLGVEYGIVSKESQYTGTAKQNTALLNAMKSGRKPTTPKPAPKPTGTIKKGSKVKIKISAKTYSTGETIPTGRKNKTYTVQQTGSKGALIKELYSWVRTSDLTLVSGGGTSAPKPSQPNVKIGQTVTATRLYTTEASTKNVRSSSIRGYVDRINNKARNPIRLRNKKGGHYIGFTRKEDIR